MLPRQRRQIANRARFIVVAGPPCSGKSTVARRLSKALDAPHLERDEFHRQVLPHSDQRVDHRDIVYRAMHLTAELMAPWCATVILDATYTAAACRTELAQVVERVGGALFVIECHVDAAVAVERFAGREAHPAVDLTTGRVADLAAEYPYCAAACAVRGASDEAANLASLIRDRRTQSLDRAGRAVWCGCGRPRERTPATAQSSVQI